MDYLARMPFSYNAKQETAGHTSGLCYHIISYPYLTTLSDIFLSFGQDRL